MTEEIYGSQEAMPADERERYHNRMVSQLVRFAYDHAPSVKQRLDAAGVKPSRLRTVTELPLIPMITREQIIERQREDPPFGGMLAVPADSLYRIIYSPGPIYVPAGTIDYCGAARNILFAVGLRKGDSAILSMPTMFMAGASIIDAMSLDGIVCIPAGAGNTELQVNIIRDLGVKGYVGTPTFLMNLVKKAEELGYDVQRDIKLRCALVWGEPLLPEVRRTLENDYHIALTNGLGVGVGLDLGYECRQCAGFHVTEHQYVEVVDPETGQQVPPGEVGVVVITGFSNNAFPIIRYNSGDLSRLDVQPCPCGRTSPRLMGILGRVGDSVKVRALYITPGQVKAVVSRFPAITRCQVVIDRVGYKDNMVFHIEMADESVDRQRLAAELEDCFQDACRLHIDGIKWLPAGAIADASRVIVDDRSWAIKKR